MKQLQHFLLMMAGFLCLAFSVNAQDVTNVESGKFLGANDWGTLASLLNTSEPVFAEEATLENWTREFTGEDQDGSFVRNTWSAENDASGITTPFIETWVWGGNGDHLSNEKMYRTIEDLQPGTYVVNLFLRAYNEMAGSSTPSGVKISANDASVDISEGQEFSYNNMAGIYDNFTIVTTVGQDGKLDIAVEVYDSNVSWIAFKNLEIFYLGEDIAPGDDEKYSIYTKSFYSLLEDAKCLTADKHYTTGQAALQKAITTAENNLARIVYVTDPDESESEAMATLNGKVIEIMTNLQTAIDAFVLGNKHVDFTEKVLNSSFDIDANNSKTITSWEVINFKQNKRDAANYNTTRIYEDGSAYRINYFVEQWCSSSRSMLDGSGDIHQTLSGLPAGHYRLTADCFAHNQQYNTECEEAVGIQLYANNIVREIGLTGFDDMTAAAFSVDFDIEKDEDVTIGFRYSDTNVNWLGVDNFTLLYIGNPNSGQDPQDGFIEIPQSQGNEYDSFSRAELVEGDDYNTYTTTTDLTIAFKMMDIDVKDCDYVVIKFAEPVAAGWNLLFWSNQDMVAVPEGATEFTYVFADDPNCGVTNGILPQISMMTFFGGYTAPLVAKVEGIYKHKINMEPESLLYYEYDDENMTATVIRGEKPYEGDVIIPASVEYNGKTYAVTAIGNEAFFDCQNLQSIAIPTSVTSIGYDAFYNCNNLTVHITDLEAWCRINMDAWANPLIYAQHFCLNGKEIHDLVIPESITNIRDRAFDSFCGLTSVTIHKDVTSFGEHPFYNCSNLTTVISMMEEPPYLNGAFDDISPKCVLCVPEGTKEAYIKADWTTRVFRGGIFEGDVPEVERVYATFDNPRNTNTIWDPETREFTWSTTYYNQLRNIGLPTGNITQYKKLVVDCTIEEGDQFRILIYQGSANKTIYVHDGVNEILLVDTLQALAPDDYASFLKDCSEICISGNNESAPGQVVIHDVYLETYPDGEEPYIPDMEEEVDPGRPDGDFVDLENWHYNTEYPIYAVGLKKAKGDIIYGARFYDGWSTPDDYADLSAYSKLTIVATPGLPLTLTFNHQFDFAGKENLEDYTEDEEGLYEWIDAVVGEDGIYELDLTQFYPVHMNYIRIPWTFEKQGTVWYLLLTEREYITGDANGDGAVDISDIVAIVNSILGKPSISFNAAAADINGDGEVDITDVVAVVNIILGKRPNNAKAREAVTQSSTLTAMTENGNTNLVVDEAKNFVAMQLDVVMPEGHNLMDVQLNSASNHAMVFNRTGENHYTVLAYSLSNEAFEPTNAALVTLFSDGAEASIEHATFITTEGHRISVDASDMATDIAGISSENQKNAIYNMAGQRMGTSIQSLPAGIYIRNGKKIQVK